MDDIIGNGGSGDAPSPSTRIAEPGDWRGAMLAKVRAMIHKAVPDGIETGKWRGVAVWEKGGIICTGESYKDKARLTFAKGAKLVDPAGLFNAGLEGNLRWTKKQRGKSGVADLAGVYRI